MKQLTGFEVWQWPEFRAFAERLGINADLATRELTIRMTEDAVTVQQEFVATESSPLLITKDELCNGIRPNPEVEKLVAKFRTAGG
jgi:hypothetical protein